MEHTGFPSDETLAAFIDGRLDAETRRKVVEHMTTCEECYSVVLGGGAGRAVLPAFDAPGRTPAHVRPRRLTAVFGSIAAAIVVAVLAWPFVQQLRNRNDGIRALAAAAPPKRSINGRLTGFPFQEKTKITRGGGDAKKSFDDDADNWAFDNAAAAVRAAEKAKPTVANQHALGIALLVHGNVTDAIGMLESAVKADSHRDVLPDAVNQCGDASLLSDLSAAYLARANENNPPSPGELTSAFNAVERAWSLAQTPEIAWNRAVIATAFTKGDVAQRAWDDYFRIDQSPQWRAEAQGLRPRKHNSRLGNVVVGDLDRALAANDQAAVIAAVRLEPAFARTHAAEDLLRRWAVAAMSGDERAASNALASCALVGDALVEVAHDSFIRDTVTSIRKRSGRELAAAFSDYGAGRECYHAERHSDAYTFLARSRSVLERTGSPFLPQVLNAEAAVDYYLDRFRESSIASDRAISLACDHGRSPLLCGECEWMRGVNEGSNDHPLEAIAAYQRARVSYDSAQAVANVAAMDGLLAEQLDHVGRYEEAQSRRLQALGVLADSDNGRAPLLLSDLCRRLVRGRYAYALGTLADSLLRIGPRDAVFEAEGRAYRSVSLSLKGDSERARGEYLAAARASEQVPEATVRRRTLFVVQDIAGDAIGREASTLSAAISALHRANKPSGLSDLYTRRGNIYLAKGDTAAAERDFRSGIHSLESSQNTISDRTINASYLRRYQALYDGMIVTRTRAGDAGGALQFCENSRLCDIRLGNRHDADITALVTSMPADLAVLDYAGVGNDLYIFAIRRGRVTAMKAAAPITAVAALVQRLDAQTSEGPTLDSLFDLLIRPLLPVIGESDRLVIIPDRVVDRVPFSVLRDRTDGRYLVQRFRIHRALSLARAVAAPVPTPQSGGVLVAAVADGASPLFPGLKHLPNVLSEAREVSARYRGAATYLQAAADKDSILAAMRRASLVHIAAHGVAVSEDQSCIVLWPSRQGGSGTLCTGDISAKAIASGALVVLATCDSATNTPDRVIASSQLATAFLTGGAGAVVATVGAVADRQSSRIVRRFHEYLAASHDPLESLRQTQLEFLAHPDEGMSAVDAGSLVVVV